jgi:hypothetical protein
VDGKFLFVTQTVHANQERIKIGEGGVAFLCGYFAKLNLCCELLARDRYITRI